MSIRALFYVNLVLSILTTLLSVVIAPVSMWHAAIMWLIGAAFLVLAFIAHLIILYTDRKE